MSGEWIAIIAVLCFVGSNVLFRKTELEASPAFINFIRTAIGTITFFIISLFFNVLGAVFLLPIELWLLLFASFLFGQVIGDTSYFQAQRVLGTTITLAISMTFPAFTFVFSLIFLNRPFNISLLISLVLIAIGIVIIGKAREETGESNSESLAQNNQPINQALADDKLKPSLKAIIFGLIAALGWATGLVMIDFATNEINRILNVEGLSSVIGNVIRFPFALLILFTLVFTENYFHRKRKKKMLQKRTIKTWAILMVASILGTSIGAYVYTEAARIAGATVMSLIASAAPLFSLPLTYLVNKERISKFGFIGVSLTVIGVIIIIL